MVRVPTYASQMNLTRHTLNNQYQLDLYTFQATTGLKAPNYSGYGMSAYNIVNLEAALGVTSNFMENNKILEVEIKALNTSVEAIDKSINDFKSILNDFSGQDLPNITPDYTGGELVFSKGESLIGKTLTLNGTQYTFAADAALDTNIDIGALDPNSDDYGTEVVEALKQKFSADNPDFAFEGNKFTFPLYTVNGTSTVLDSPNVATGEPHIMGKDQYLNMQQLQTSAFSAMKMIADSLNTYVNGKYIFGGGVSSQAPISFPFNTLEEFQSYYDGINIQYPQNTSANLSNRNVTSRETGKITLSTAPEGGNHGVITAENAGAFLKEAVKANEKTTGDITFDAANNTIYAQEYGAFNSLSAGDTLVINNAGDDKNGAYIIKSVSEDGRTITFDEKTPIRPQADPTLPNGEYTDGGVTNNVTFSTSFPVGAVINMNGFQDINRNIAENVQVTGVSADGKELYVTMNPDRWIDITIDSPNWEMSAESYYRGGDLSTERMITENQSVTMDINAKDPAFEKLFRALGTIAQGNLVDTRDPADDLDSLIDPQTVVDRINEALDLVSEGIFNGGKNAEGKNADLYTIQAKINSNYIVLNNANDNLTQVKTNLENSVDSLKNVNREEAFTKAIMAYNTLNSSYAALQQALNASLLNYMK